MKRVKSQNQMRVTFQSPKQSIEPDYKSLALSTRLILTNSYASFFENDKVWTKDYEQTYKNLYRKLKKIVQNNLTLLKTTMYT
jgi:hypothetical protein